jgi:hypothetical protein
LTEEPLDKMSPLFIKEATDIVVKEAEVPKAKERKKPVCYAGKKYICLSDYCYALLLHRYVVTGENIALTAVEIKEAMLQMLRYQQKESKLSSVRDLLRVLHKNTGILTTSGKYNRMYSLSKEFLDFFDGMRKDGVYIENMWYNESEIQVFFFLYGKKLMKIYRAAGYFGTIATLCFAQGSNADVDQCSRMIQEIYSHHNGSETAMPKNIQNKLAKAVSQTMLAFLG